VKVVRRRPRREPHLLVEFTTFVGLTAILLAALHGPLGWLLAINIALSASLPIALLAGLLPW